MIEIRQTERFVKWLNGLTDDRGFAKIVTRIERAVCGNLGDVKFFDGIGEMRITHGPGYRLYFVRRGNALVILLCGGDKSTQRKDIATALQMAKEI